MREKLLLESEITRCAKFGENLIVGIKDLGEYSMLQSRCNLMLFDQTGADYINFGEMEFMNIRDAERFYISSSDGEFMIMQWIFFWIQDHILPILVHVPSKKFKFFDTRRYLVLDGMVSIGGLEWIRMSETKWKGEEIQDSTFDVEITLDSMKPIEELYSLDVLQLTLPILTREDGETHIAYL